MRTRSQIVQASLGGGDFASVSLEACKQPSPYSCQLFMELPLTNPQYSRLTTLGNRMRTPAMGR